jgi:hypothetical protein
MNTLTKNERENSMLLYSMLFPCDLRVMPSNPPITAREVKGQHDIIENNIREAATVTQNLCDSLGQIGIKTARFS